MRKKGAAAIFRPVDPNLRVVSGNNNRRGRNKTLIEYQAAGMPDASERIRANPARNHKVREYDDDWNSLGDPVCPICRREVPELFPHGWSGKRLACADCLERRRRLLEQKARILEAREARYRGRQLMS